MKENSKPEAPNPTHVLSSTQGRLQAPLTYGSRFPGADSERSSRRLPSNGFPKDRFRIIVLTKICKTRGGLVRLVLLSFHSKVKAASKSLFTQQENSLERDRERKEAMLFSLDT